MLTLFQNLESRWSNHLVPVREKVDSVFRSFILLSLWTFLSFFPTAIFFSKFWPICPFSFFNSCKADLQATLRARYQLAHRPKGRGSTSKMV